MPLHTVPPGAELLRLGRIPDLEGYREELGARCCLARNIRRKYRKLCLDHVGSELVIEPFCEIRSYRTRDLCDVLREAEAWPLEVCRQHWRTPGMRDVR